MLKMDCSSYNLEQNLENSVRKLDSDIHFPSHVDTPVCDIEHTDIKYEIKSVDGATETKSENFMMPSSSGINSRPKVASELLVSSSESEEPKNLVTRTGRASVVRLQAAPASSTETSVDRHDSELQLEVSCLVSAPEPCENEKNRTQLSSLSPTVAKETVVNSNLISPSYLDDVPNPEVMQRYLMSDGQCVYGYKDSDNQYHFFYPTLDERESHNEKERKRRRRVSDACSSLRRLVPGLDNKVDKASVFELAASYLKFLRSKYGTIYDQAYFEKYFTENS